MAETIPKLAAPSVVPGSAKFGTVIKLNTSVRNCSLMASRMWNSLNAEKSTCRCGGPNT